MDGKDTDISNTECSELCDLLKKIAVNTTESAGNNETTAYCQDISFTSDPANNSLNIAAWS